ncbi:APC family permease [Deltaproteobacteria bacterium OttesenSCG-928-K17]|nr:APC family permease [Deltaproteobacteria bacterium OttesenSCG-928-K17]
MSTKDLKRELGKKELFGLAIGQVIGAGIMALVGLGIAMTGRSVNMAFVLSAVWVVLLSIPWIFISSSVRLRGGEYTQAAVLCGEKFAGFYIVIYLVRNLQMAVYTLAFTSYFVSLVPGANGLAVSLIVATFFFGLNVFPTKFMAKFQNLMVIVLCAALAAFVVYGMPQVEPGYFKQPGFFTKGPMGFLAASAFLTFATFGANSIFQLSGECKNPKTDIPFVLIASTLSVAVLYGLVATVAAGVLPVEEVAGENLAKVAQTILSSPLYMFFMVGGALGALATSLNATIAWVTKPLIQACEDGWFPRKLAYLHPKYKTPVFLIGIYYLVTITPILLGIDMGQITNSVLVIMYLCMIVTSMATIRLPKILPDQWAKSPFKCSQGLLTALCVLASVVLAIQIYFNAGFLSTELFIANVVLMAAALIYSIIRHKSGQVKMDISYEDD